MQPASPPEKNMASQFNLLLHTYPKFRSSTPCTMKTSRLELAFLIKKGHRSSFQTRKISPSPRIACSQSSELYKEGDNYDLAATAVSPSWVETCIPERARPYAYLMRLQKLRAWPGLITMPCLWSIAFTTEPGNLVDTKMLALFTLVGTVYRGIHMTVNDILDRDIDAKIKRTKMRPLASGVLTLYQGLSCLGLQILLCFCLLLQVNSLSRKLWFASLAVTVTYPLTKRLTFWPQAYLGLAINSFNLCGWAAVKGGLDPRILLPLCTSGFFWTMVYETIYSHQDKEDDAKNGVKSPALLLGNSTKTWTSGFAVACIGALALTGSLASIGWPYYVSLVAASIHLTWQILTVDLDSPTDCNTKFESNTQLGAIILCGILLGGLYQ